MVLLYLPSTHLTRDINAVILISWYLANIENLCKFRLEVLLLNKMKLTQDLKVVLYGFFGIL